MEFVDIELRDAVENAICIVEPGADQRQPSSTFKHIADDFANHFRNKVDTIRKTRLRPWSNHVRRRLFMLSSSQPHHPSSRRSSWARQTSIVRLIRRQLGSLSDFAQCCVERLRASAKRCSSRVCCRRARSTPSSDRGWKSPHWILTTWTPSDPSPTWVSYRRSSNEWWRYASSNTWKHTIYCITHTILPKSRDRRPQPNSTQLEPWLACQCLGPARPEQRLWHRRSHYPPRGTRETFRGHWIALKWYFSYVDERMQTFQVSSQLSAAFVVHCSVSQGTVLRALKLWPTQRINQP